MSKTSQKQQTTELPPELKQAAVENINAARKAAAIPYAPNRGLQVAAFTPMQEAAFKGTDMAASAFGLPTSGGSTGLPKAENVGGFRGYSTNNLYDDMLAKMDPKAREAISGFFSNLQKQAPIAMQRPQSSGGGRK